MRQRGLIRFNFLLIALLLVSLFAITQVSADQHEGTGNDVPLGSDDSFPDDSSAGTGTSVTRIDTSSRGGTGAGGDFKLSIKDVDCDKPFDSLSFFPKRYCLWKEGVKALEDPTKVVVIGETLKWFVLILVLLLSYSGFTYARFPDSFIVRGLLSLVIGILATFLITTQELITTLLSYTALGITFSIMLPLLALGFVTFMIGSNLGPMGMYLQKIGWLIYSLYLFFKTVTLYILMNSTMDPVKGLQLPGWADNVVGDFFVGPVVSSGAFLPSSLETLKASNDGVMLSVLFVTSIAVFVIMVLGKKYVDAWIAKEQLDSAVHARSVEQKKVRAIDKLKAADLDSS